MVLRPHHTVNVRLCVRVCAFSVQRFVSNVLIQIRFPHLHLHWNSNPFKHTHRHTSCMHINIWQLLFFLSFKSCVYKSAQINSPTQSKKVFKLNRWWKPSSIQLSIDKWLFEIVCDSVNQPQREIQIRENQSRVKQNERKKLNWNYFLHFLHTAHTQSLTPTSKYTRRSIQKYIVWTIDCYRNIFEDITYKNSYQKLVTIKIWIVVAEESGRDGEEEKKNQTKNKNPF